MQRGQRTAPDGAALLALAAPAPPLAAAAIVEAAAAAPSSMRIDEAAAAAVAAAAVGVAAAAVVVVLTTVPGAGAAGWYPARAATLAASGLLRITESAACFSTAVPAAAAETAAAEPAAAAPRAATFAYRPATFAAWLLRAAAIQAAIAVYSGLASRRRRVSSRAAASAAGFRLLSCRDPTYTTPLPPPGVCAEATGIPAGRPLGDRGMT